jgi:ElaA protein
MTAAVTWSEKPFAELSNSALYEILQLRQLVFVVEQQCVYLDVDGHDPRCWHLAGHDLHGLVAYARLIPPGLLGAEVSIGRVATDPRARGSGVGKLLMQQAIEHVTRRWGGAIVISAQAYLQRFYRDFGFVAVGKEYLEDGIPHIEMRRS